MSSFRDTLEDLLNAAEPQHIRKEGAIRRIKEGAANKKVGMEAFLRDFGSRLTPEVRSELDTSDPNTLREHLKKFNESFIKPAFIIHYMASEEQSKKDCGGRHAEDIQVWWHEGTNSWAFRGCHQYHPKLEEYDDYFPMYHLPCVKFELKNQDLFEAHQASAVNYPETITVNESDHLPKRERAEASGS